MAQGSFGHTMFAFNGRINRGKFWLGQVVGLVASYAIMGVGLVFSPGLISAVSNPAVSPAVSPLTIVCIALGGILALWISLATMIKRCHDRGKSGWWVLIVLIPLAGFIWMIIDLGALEGEPGDNAWGPNPLGGPARGVAMAR